MPKRALLKQVYISCLMLRKWFYCKENGRQRYSTPYLVFSSVYGGRSTLKVEHARTQVFPVAGRPAVRLAYL